MKQIKKSLAAVLALMMCLSLLPVNVFAAELQAIHEHNQDGWNCTFVEDSRELAYEHDQHQHTADCYQAAEPILACGLEHAHDEFCYDADGNVVCGLEEHINHSWQQGCYLELCGLAEHTHSEELGCVDVETGELVS